MSSECKLCNGTREYLYYDSTLQTRAPGPCRCTESPAQLIEDVSTTISQISQLKNLTQLPQLAFEAQNSLRKLGIAVNP